MEQTIPMHSRMIHSGNVGEPGEGQAYDGVFGRYINSMDRADLNCQMLDALEERDRVKLCFEKKLVRLKLDGPEGAEAVFVE